VEHLSTSSKVTIEVRRATGLTARRAELDGFNGAMARLRETYNALNTTPPVAAPPDILIDAMQTGDRLGYRPELAQKEIKHFHEEMPRLQAAVDTLVGEAQKRLDEFAKHPPRHEVGTTDIQAEIQKRSDALARAQKLVGDTEK
jgi:alpha-glucosidase